MGLGCCWLVDKRMQLGGQEDAVGAHGGTSQVGEGQVAPWLHNVAKHISRGEDCMLVMELVVRLEPVPAVWMRAWPSACGRCRNHWCAKCTVERQMCMCIDWG